MLGTCVGGWLDQASFSFQKTSFRKNPFRGVNRNEVWKGLGGSWVLGGHQGAAAFVTMPRRL